MRDEPSELELKQLLCDASVHLHARIIMSACIMKDTIVFAIPDRAPPLFLESIQRDFAPLKTTLSAIENNHCIALSHSEKSGDIQFLLVSLKKMSHRVAVVWDVKQGTDRFDFSVLYPKERGSQRGFKADNIFLKEFLFEYSDIHEFFAYLVLNKLLGTKSPQVDLIKGEQSYWMTSQDLSRSYKKDDIKKEKRFLMVSALFPDCEKQVFNIDWCLSVPSWITAITPIHYTQRDRKIFYAMIQIVFPSQCDHAYLSTLTPDALQQAILNKMASCDSGLNEVHLDEKSILKIMFLSILMNLDDLSIDNIGSLNSTHSIKLAVVDFLVNVPEGCSRLILSETINSWQQLAAALYVYFIESTCGTVWDDRALLILVAKALKSGEGVFLDALNSILLPHTESRLKSKTHPVFTSFSAIFRARPPTFLDTLRAAQEEMQSIFAMAGVPTTALESVVSKAVLEYQAVIVGRYEVLMRVSECLQSNDKQGRNGVKP